MGKEYFILGMAAFMKENGMQGIWMAKENCTITNKRWHTRENLNKINFKVREFCITKIQSN